MIKLENITKKYDDKLVLKIDNLLIEDNEFVALIGPNGAGKTTLLEVIAGLIEYDGLVNLKCDYKDMTMVFQNPYLISTSVYNNLAYPLKLRKYNDKAINEMINEISIKLKIDDLLSKQYDALSAGERQKVTIARALIFKPKILLLDEPTANLDPEMTKEIEKLLKEINLDTTIILITHSLAMAKRLSKRVIYLENGEIIEDNSSDNIFSNHQSIKLRNFIESETINGTFKDN